MYLRYSVSKNGTARRSGKPHNNADTACMYMLCTLTDEVTRTLLPSPFAALIWSALYIQVVLVDWGIALSQAAWSYSSCSKARLVR